MEEPQTGIARSYRSQVRAERAAQTRRRITDAAGELFKENGFAGTTVAGIAARAGVTAQTVYATFGSKGAIVGAILDQFEQHADGRSWAARIRAEDDPARKLAAFAGWTTALLSTSKAVIRSVQGAIGDPALDELRRQGDAHRRAALVELVTGLLSARSLRTDIGTDRCVDRAWLLTGVELYLNATDGCGWSDEDYSNWLATLLQTELLAPGSDLSPTR